MARPKASDGYPSIFSQIIRKVAETGVEFHHSCESTSEAQHLRFSFYDYRKALSRFLCPGDEELHGLATMLKFTIKGSVLIIALQDNSKIAQSLTATFDKTFAPTSAVQAFRSSEPAGDVPGSTAVDNLLSDFLPK